MQKKAVRVVIADDNADIRQTLKDILTELGYLVDTVKDGYELVGYLKKNEPQIIVLDLMMPEKDGIEVFDCLKCIQPKSKVIIYTGFHKYETSSFARIADRFVLKDASPQKLLDAIKELASGFSAANQSNSK